MSLRYLNGWMCADLELQRKYSCFAVRLCCEVKNECIFTTFYDYIEKLVETQYDLLGAGMFVDLKGNHDQS